MGKKTLFFFNPVSVHSTYLQVENDFLIKGIEKIFCVFQRYKFDV